MSIVSKLTEDIHLVEQCAYIIYENDKPLVAASCKEEAVAIMRSLAGARLSELQKDPRVPVGKLCIKIEETNPDNELTVTKQEIGRVYNGIKRNVSVIRYEGFPMATVCGGSKHCPIDAIIRDCTQKMASYHPDS